MSDIVIVAYRAKPGREEDLRRLTRRHVPLLRRLNFATKREPIIMEARDGVIIEVFEWQSGAISRAHEHPDVIALWQEYAAVCDYVPLSSLKESSDIFAQFKPLRP